MAMQFYASPEQVQRDRSEYARKGIARGRSAVVLTYEGGVLFVAENLTIAAQGQRDLRPDRLRRRRPLQRVREPAPGRRADGRPATGLSYDRRDVTGRALANAYTQTLGAIFTETQKPYEVEICVAQVGATPEQDELYRITYDGSVNDEPGFMAMGGQAEAISNVLKSRHSGSRVAERRAHAGGGGARQRRRRERRPRASSGAAQLEVAVLDRSRKGRAFRRITGAALTTLLGGGSDTPEKELGDAGASADAAPPAPGPQKPTVSAASVDLEDGAAKGGAAKVRRGQGGRRPGARRTTHVVDRTATGPASPSGGTGPVAVGTTLGTRPAGIDVPAAGSTGGAAASASSRRSGRHHCALSRYQMTVAASPVGEVRLRPVAELRADLRVVQGVPLVVALAVLDVRDAVPAGPAGRQQQPGQLPVGQLGAAADVVDLAGPPTGQRQRHARGSGRRTCSQSRTWLPSP